MSEALRFNSGKPHVSYILHFPCSIESIARIMEYGAKKYGDMNWAKGGKPDTEYLDSCMRHILKFVEGEPIDEESGCHHIGHAIWNLLALMDLNLQEPFEPISFKIAMEKFNK